jgi:hypothetical protein
LPYDLPEKFGTDFAGTGMSPSVDDRPRSGRDEWGSLWENLGATNLGQVRDVPLKDWREWDKLTIPDVRDERRWEGMRTARAQAGGRFLLANGVSLYERVHFIRGLENTWTDIYDQPENLGRLLDLLVDMNLYAIARSAAAGADGYFFADDWGLQDRLMISPAKWLEIWKPRYARVYQACHSAGVANL